VECRCRNVHHVGQVRAVPQCGGVGGAWSHRDSLWWSRPCYVSLHSRVSRYAQHTSVRSLVESDHARLMTDMNHGQWNQMDLLHTTRYWWRLLPREAITRRGSPSAYECGTRSRQRLRTVLPRARDALLLGEHLSYSHVRSLRREPRQRSLCMEAR